MLSRDQSQRVFSQSFEEFSGRMVPPRLTRGANMLKQYGSVLSRIEKDYGVPGEVLVAIWGLETDYGVNIGKFPTLRSLATLAYDCRRSELFRAELMDALRIVERGDLAPSEMRGAWAGELGQTQFMPSSYIKYAVDFDGNGRRDLLRSAPDVLASTANYLAGYGWQRGKDWEPGSANFAVIQQWNKSEVYSKTIAYFAEPAVARALNGHFGQLPVEARSRQYNEFCIHYLIETRMRITHDETIISAPRTVQVSTSSHLNRRLQRTILAP